MKKETTKSGTMEHSAGVVLFRQMKDHREYLLLHYPGGHFDFPKGHLEAEESEREAAIRELKEETGIEKVTWIEGYKFRIQYFFHRNGALTPKDVIYFLARTTQKKVNISFEHKGFIWLPYEDAMKKVTYPNTRNALEKAEKFLNRL